MSGYFITGTDTDSGKTFITLALMQALQQQGKRVNAYKPVAAGTERFADQSLNPDAWLMLQGNSTVKDYAMINPVLFDEFVAPHLAARQHNRRIDIDGLVKNYQSIAAQSDVVLVEGAGGWLVPLDEKHDIADLARRLQLPVILVVGIRLGCINHARLTLQAIRHTGIELIGWVGSVVDEDMQFLAGNIDTLKSMLNLPCLGIVPFMQKPDVNAAAALLALDLL